MDEAKTYFNEWEQYGDFCEYVEELMEQVKREVASLLLEQGREKLYELYGMYEDGTNSEDFDDDDSLEDRLKNVLSGNYDIVETLMPALGMIDYPAAEDRGVEKQYRFCNANDHGDSYIGMLVDFLEDEVGPLGYTSVNGINVISLSDLNIDYRPGGPAGGDSY